VITSLSIVLLASVREAEVPGLPTFGTLSLCLAGIGIFLLLNAFFVAAEFAIVKARPSQVEAAAKGNGVDPLTVKRLTKHFDGYLAAIQLGITFSSVALGFLGQPIAATLIAPLLAGTGLPSAAIYWISLAIAFAVFSFLHLIIGGLVPKSIATRKSVGTMLLLLGPLHAFYRAFRWFVGLCSGAANGLLRGVFQIEPISDGEQAHSAEELAVLVAQSGKSMEVTETEREILINALELNDLWVRDVMTPRNKVIVLDADEPFAKTLEVAMRSKHTRFPLVKGHLDQAIGLIHIKDLFKLLSDPDPDLMRIKRDLKIVPDTMPLDTLLQFFLREHAHLALVVDEFGTPVGIVFLDNVMEELVGDIQDEFDNERSAFTRVNDDEFVIEGSMTLNDLADHAPELFLESGEVTTIGGYVTQQLGRFPEVGETLEILGYEAKVTSTDGRRVGQIHFRQLAGAEAPADDDQAASA